MGMTDKQFDAYQLERLRRLEQVQKNLAQKNIKEEILDEIIQDIRDQLKRP